MDAQMILAFRLAVRELTTHPLAIEQIDQVFPLVQASLPHLDLEDWRAFGRERLSTATAGRQGIQSVVAEQNYIAGLCIYRIEAVLYHGPVLVAEHFMVLDLFDRQAVAHALVEFLEDLGRRHGCGTLHTHIAEGAGRLPEPGGGLASILCQEGHAVESLLFCKSLNGAAKRRPRVVSA